MECVITALQSRKECLQKGKRLKLKTSSAKQKGRKLQQWVRDQILARCPQLEEDDVKSTSMGAQGEDVQLSPAARRMFPFTVECKNLAKVAVYNYYEQAKTHGKHEPLVVVKQNGHQPLAIINAEKFIDMVVKIEELKNHVDVLLLVKGTK